MLSSPAVNVPIRNGSSGTTCHSEGRDTLEPLVTPGSFRWVMPHISPDENKGPCLIVSKAVGPFARENTKRLHHLAKTASPQVAASIRQHLDDDAAELVRGVELGFRSGQAPELCSDCCGGTYFLHDQFGDTLAVFKPSDEEPYAPENPKGYVGTAMYGTSPMKEGVEVGLAAERELAAYLLDHGHRAGVPRTVLVKIHNATNSNLKSGSLQEFLRNKCSAEDMGASKFREADVHNIAMLDIRLCNSDRHPGNILVTDPPFEDRDGGLRLVPIDHGYVLPKWRYLHEVDLCWLYWPQAKQPFTAEEKEFIESIDLDAEMLFLGESLSLTDDCLRTLTIGTTLLKLGAAAGLTLFDLGEMMVRSHPDERSVLETCVHGSEDLAIKELRRSSHVFKALAAQAGPTSSPKPDAMRESFLRHLRQLLGVEIRRVLVERHPDLPVPAVLPVPSDGQMSPPSNRLPTLDSPPQPRGQVDLSQLDELEL